MQLVSLLSHFLIPCKCDVNVPDARQYTPSSAVKRGRAMKWEKTKVVAALPSKLFQLWLCGLESEAAHEWEKISMERLVDFYSSKRSEPTEMINHSSETHTI